MSETKRNEQPQEEEVEKPEVPQFGLGVDIRLNKKHFDLALNVSNCLCYGSKVSLYPLRYSERISNGRIHNLFGLKHSYKNETDSYHLNISHCIENNDRIPKL